MKTSNNTGGIYPQVVQLNGKNAPQYSDIKYQTIAKEGYSRNWIIYRCIQEIIRAAIQLDWKVYHYNKDGKPEVIENHPIQQLIEHPNPTYGEAELIKRAIAFYYIAGDSPFVKMMAGGTAKELYAYRPDRISFNVTGDVNEPYSDIKYEGQSTNIDPTNFLLWKNFNPLDRYDGLGRGMSMLEPILKNGDLLNSMIDWNVSLLQNGGNTSGVVAVDGTLPDKEYDRAKAQLKNEHSGKDNVGKYMLLEGGAKFYQTSNSPKDMDWAKGKEAVMKDICIGIGVDPLIIGFNESATYDNKNEAEKGMYTKLVIPLMRELADQLGPFLGIGEGEYLDVDYAKIPVLQEDIEKINKRLDNNEMTVNEKRIARGLEKLPGGDIVAPQGSYAIINGKVYLPMNLISIDEEDQHDSGSGSEKVNDSGQKSFMY